ncbi:hypothetical protein AALB39_04310 [Lachnospiraceae bacterium 54-53]
MKNDTRFFKRDAFLIDFNSFTEVMREIYDDESLDFEEDYPTLSLYSSWHDCGYDEEEILERISDYLGIKIIACCIFKDLEEIYFVSRRN